MAIPGPGVPVHGLSCLGHFLVEFLKLVLHWAVLEDQLETTDGGIFIKALYMYI